MHYFRCSFRQGAPLKKQDRQLYINADGLVIMAETLSLLSVFRKFSDPVFLFHRQRCQL